MIKKGDKPNGEIRIKDFGKRKIKNWNESYLPRNSLSLVPEVPPTDCFTHSTISFRNDRLGIVFWTKCHLCYEKIFLLERSHIKISLSCRLCIQSEEIQAKRMSATPNDVPNKYFQFWARFHIRATNYDSN